MINRVSYDDDEDFNSKRETSLKQQNSEVSSDREKMLSFYKAGVTNFPESIEKNKINSSNHSTSNYLEVTDDGFWTKPDISIPLTQQERRGRARHCLDLNSYILNNDLTPEQMTGYQVYYRIEELTKQLQENDYSYCRIAQRERSPSPPPIYDTTGNRTNTRENRYKKKLDDERIKLIELAVKSLPNYNAPENYVKPNFFKEKFFVPVDEYKNINFVGLLLGPRGATLRNLQQESGCRIQIRGKGSFKEGRSQEELPKGSMSVSEPLHCLVIANSEMKLKNGLKACEAVVMKAITSPSGQNDLKREQLKELAKLNGTFRDMDAVACPICGNLGHNRFNCPKSDKYLETIQCTNCEQFGHLQQDCFVINRQKRQLENRFESTEVPEQQVTKLQKIEVDNQILSVPTALTVAEKPIVTNEDIVISTVNYTEVQPLPLDQKNDKIKQVKLQKPEDEKSHSYEIAADSSKVASGQKEPEEEELAPPQMESDEEELVPPQMESDDEELAPPPMNILESE